MQHLNDEALARLVDEPAEPHEAAHLRDCLFCRRGLEELREQTLTLSALADPQLPAAGWQRLEAALQAEGLLRVGEAPQPARGVIALAPRRWWRHPAGLRVAAALVLFVLGGAAGAALWSRQQPAPLAAREPAVSDPVVVHPSPSAPAVLTDAAAAPEPADVPNPAGVRLASAGTPAASPRPAALRQAERDLAEAEGAYVAALQRYAAVADPASGADPQTRLDALERMITTTRAALERAPADPLINGYHLVAVRERDALQRQIATGDKDWF